MSSIASSSKRTPAVKRQRSESSDVEDTIDDAAMAKQARKDARTIRNRESAQRSRNQRKAHMSWLEVRVAELEAENKALRGDREPSPSLSITTVNLASVAPPPADLDVKPVIEPTLTSIQAENAALKERIVLLEDLVKQVVAVSNLAGIDKPVPSGITQTLSPNFTPVTDPSPDPFTLVPEQTLTCHPAAMATSDKLALQRVQAWETPAENWDKEMRLLLERLEGKEVVDEKNEFGWALEGFAEVIV